jgi:hypothetical protein
MKTILASILAVAFLASTPVFAADNPAGSVILDFEGGGAIRLDVECLEAAMSDLDPGRPCNNSPASRE